MDGIINFLKPAGMTSHDAVSFFRRLTGIRKVGHTGTLDPMAAGVLPICIGKATRLIEYLEGDKSYRAIMRLGVKSETGDIWGNELETVEVPKILELEGINECLKSFEGRITQRVPGFSAQKHDGRKLYEYARAGEEIPVKEKKVDIKNVTVIAFDDKKKEVAFDIFCSKGTYVRTICTDAGEKLGTGGVMNFLLRTTAGGLDVKDSVTAEELKSEIDSAGNINKYLRDPGDLLKNMNRIVLSKADARLFVNGIVLDKRTDDETYYAVFTASENKGGKLIGIGRGRNKKLKPHKVIISE